MTMPTQGDYNNEAVGALARMTPAQRAIQLFTATLANAGNSASFGGLGAVGDIARGTPWGTTGGQLSAQVQAASPVADTASKVLGAVGSGKALVAALPVASGVVRSALTAAPTIGTRAAALGATSPTYAGTAARLVAPAAAALGLGAYLNNGEAAPAVVPVAVDPNVPTTGPHAGQTGGVRFTGGPVETALAAGRAAPADPQRDLATALSTVLGKNPSISDLQAIGGLVPAAIKPTATQRDMVFGNAYAQSKAIADQQVAALSADAAAGKITSEQAKAGITKVLQTHFDQTAGLVGFNPANMANAAILNGSSADAQ